MKTPTHMLIGHVINRLCPGDAAARKPWVILGAAAPDAPLIILVAACLVLTRFLGGSDGDVVDLVDYFYFGNDTFIALHHVLHSPASLASVGVAWWALAHLWNRYDRRVLWFLSGAASHALVDLFTHGPDGILLFWPWNRTYRFNSGVDQWDMAGSGAIVLMVEGSLFLTYGVFVAWSRWRPFFVFSR